jgi:hypothetical protein
MVFPAGIPWEATGCAKKNAPVDFQRPAVCLKSSSGISAFATADFTIPATTFLIIKVIQIYILL